MKAEEIKTVVEEEKFKEALRYANEKGEAGKSILQRELGIGFAKADRFFEVMGMIPGAKRIRKQGLEMLEVHWGLSSEDIDNFNIGMLHEPIPQNFRETVAYAFERLLDDGVVFTFDDSELYQEDDPCLLDTECDAVCEFCLKKEGNADIVIDLSLDEECCVEVDYVLNAEMPRKDFEKIKAAFKEHQGLFHLDFTETGGDNKTITGMTLSIFGDFGQEEFKEKVDEIARFYHSNSTFKTLVSKYFTEDLSE